MTIQIWNDRSFLKEADFERRCGEDFGPRSLNVISPSAAELNSFFLNCCCVHLRLKTETLKSPPTTGQQRALPPHGISESKTRHLWEKRLVNVNFKKKKREIFLSKKYCYNHNYNKNFRRISAHRFLLKLWQSKKKKDNQHKQHTFIF